MKRLEFQYIVLIALKAILYRHVIGETYSRSSSEKALEKVVSGISKIEEGMKK